MWALHIPIDMCVYVISFLHNKQTSKITAEVFPIPNIPLIDLIKLYSAPPNQTRRQQFSEGKGTFTSGKNVFMTLICSDESTNVKFLTQQAVIAQHWDSSHYSWNMSCTVSAPSQQTCCQAITHFHHLAFLPLQHSFSFLLYYFQWVSVYSAYFKKQIVLERKLCLSGLILNRKALSSP